MTKVASELEELRDAENVPGTENSSLNSSNHSHNSESSHEFPHACLVMLYSLPGNNHCFDCKSPGPRWASVTYGVLLCTECCGRHRSYGVQTSFMRSIDMDDWNHKQVLSMLEGGNEQLHGFFERHQMGNNYDFSSSSITSTRYRTKAALYYSSHLKMHVEAVALSGAYKGREAQRRKQQQQQHHSKQQPVHHCGRQQAKIIAATSSTNMHREHQCVRQS